MHIRRLVALHIQQYRDAEGAGDEQRLQYELRFVCSGLARILGRLLERNPERGPYRWVDDILPNEVTVLCGRHEAIVRGLVVWGVVSGTTQEWVDPIEVTIKLSCTGRRIARIEAKLGNASAGLGTVEFKWRSELDRYPSPVKWLLEVSG